MGGCGARLYILTRMACGRFLCSNAVRIRREHARTPETPEYDLYVDDHRLSKKQLMGKVPRDGDDEEVPELI